MNTWGVYKNYFIREEMRANSYGTVKMLEIEMPAHIANSSVKRTQGGSQIIRFTYVKTCFSVVFRWESMMFAVKYEHDAKWTV